MRALSSLLLLSLLFLHGCLQIELPREELSQEELLLLQRFIPRQPTTPVYPLSATFDDEIELLGLDIQGELVPGEEVRIVWYWRALSEVQRDWKIFVHLDSLESPLRHNLDHYPLQDPFEARLRTYHLPPGEIIADLQRFTLREDFPPGQARLFVGLFQGSERARVSPSSDGNRRFSGPDLTIRAEPAPGIDVLPVQIRDGIRREIRRRVDLQGGSP